MYKPAAAVPEWRTPTASKGEQRIGACSQQNGLLLGMVRAVTPTSVALLTCGKLRLRCQLVNMLASLAAIFKRVDSAAGAGVN